MTGTRKRRSGPRWADWPDEELLDLRLCDLGVRVEGTAVEERIQDLREELERRMLRFHPHFWLSSDWFSPDGVPGVAVPFYLAHPRLRKLEETQMLEVEGGTRDACMRLLRHETGHAIDTAYRLHRRKRWRELFGPWSAPYNPTYHPKPYSKRFVLHLDLWYSQSHPAEDFAETFAVWLRPGSDWRKRYARWPALRKLEYVDELMKEIAGKKPPVRNREHTESLPTLKRKLRDHYRDKQERYGGHYPDFYDRDLRRLFADAAADSGGPSAAAFLRRARPDLRRIVARWTGQYRYTIDQVLVDMIERCKELGLRLDRPEAEVLQEATVLLTVQTMNFLHGGHHRMAR